MKEKTKDNYDFSDFLLDDEFVSKVKEEKGSDEYIASLKAQFPGQEINIGLALEVLKTMENKRVYSTQRQRKKVWSLITFGFPKSKQTENSFHLSERKTQIFRNSLRVAACFILVLGIGALTFYSIKNKNDKDLSIDRFTSSNLVDYQKSQLILTDGKKIEVSSGDSRIIYSADGGKVTVNDTTGVNQVVRNEQFNQMIVPYGKYASIKLSDGTKVWLNSGSRIVFPPVFSGKYREVYLQGEGYFEVTKNAERPFRVKTDRLKVEVLGTKFDVQAYAKDNSYSTLLLEGSVSLSLRQDLKKNYEDVILKQSEKGEFSETSNKFIVEKMTHPENFIAWTCGYLNFDDEALDKLLKRISRYYNIEIQLRSGLGPFKISGKLDLKEDPERVLKGIAIIAKMKLYKQKGGYIIRE